jgi:hypothetical protein
MKDYIRVLQRLNELVVRLARTKWDMDDTVREQAAHELEWSTSGYSKNLLDVLVIRMIRYALVGELNSLKARSAIDSTIADFWAVKQPEGRAVSGYLLKRAAASDDPYLDMGFIDALDKRLDRFETYADVPFPGKTLKTS